MKTATTENDKIIHLVEATSANIEIAFSAIKEFARNNNYQIMWDGNKGGMHVPTNILGIAKPLKFASKRKKKLLRRYLTKIIKHVTMREANRFLYFLYKNIEPFMVDGDQDLMKAPYIEYSEKELKIKEARKGWKLAKDEAEKLRLAYKVEKGNFYKITSTFPSLSVKEAENI